MSLDIHKFSVWLATKVRVEDLGFALSLPELKWRPGWVYGGGVIVRERGPDERLIFGPREPFSFRFGGEEFIVCSTYLMVTEQRAYECALNHGADMALMPSLLTMRTCRRCGEPTPSHKKTCQSCGVRWYRPRVPKQPELAGVST